MNKNVGIYFFIIIILVIIFLFFYNSSKKSNKNIISDEMTFNVNNIPEFTDNFSQSLDNKGLKDNEADYYKINRGGDITYHGPGQIVIYPIVNLKSIGFSTKEARRFVETLSQAVLECCQAWQLPAQTGENPFGIYLEEIKIVSFGLSFQNGISSHGLSVCFSPQQKFFSGIRPCGQSESVFTSLQEHVPSLTWHNAAISLTDSIKKSFKIS